RSRAANVVAGRGRASRRDPRPRSAACAELGGAVLPGRDSAPDGSQRGNPADHGQGVRAPLAVLLRVFADELVQVVTFRERGLMQVPVVLGHPEVEIGLGAMGEVV